MSKTGKITIHKIAVLEDIDAQTFKRVDGVLSTESDQFKNALSSDSTEGLDSHILYRHMEHRDASIRKKLAFCLLPDNDNLSVCNLLDMDQYFRYDLSVPDTFDRQRLKIVAERMHYYMVQGTLHDWYATQNMKGNVSSEELQEIENDIVAMLRPSSVKRPLQPFGPRN